VRKPARNKKHIKIAIAQLKPAPPPKRRRPRPDINGDIKYRTPDDAHQLALLKRRGLKMQPAYNAHRNGFGVIVLNEGGVNTRRGENRRRIGLKEEAAAVGVNLRLDQYQPVNVRLYEFHVSIPLNSAR
jgi:hypothetical protein